MLPADILKKIRRIEIRTNRLVNESLAGEYHSVFKGRGMEFSEVREYQFGDDIRSIDWNVTSRMGHPYVKKHVEERELTVMLLVDFSASGELGSRRRSRRASTTGPPQRSPIGGRRACRPSVFSTWRTSRPASASSWTRRTAAPASCTESGRSAVAPPAKPCSGPTPSTIWSCSPIAPTTCPWSVSSTGGRGG